MKKITFCLPSKNNLRYLKSSIRSIQENSTIKDHEIIVWVDGDNDGTIEWLKSQSNVKFLINSNPQPQGIAAGYNRCISATENDIVCMFHADMFMGKGFDENILKHLKPNTVVAGTRIEPPLHPPGAEKIIQDFGMYPEDFKESEFNEFVEKIKKEHKDQITRGIFAPWACYKKDIVEIGMHDEFFHSYHEDSDIFNRFILKGMDIIQSRDALVYHLTCRGGQFQDGIDKITSDKNFHIMKQISARHYVRKWGSWIQNDPYQYPIIPPKYNIGIRVKNCNLNLLEFLEPWCDRIYVDCDFNDYIKKEQNNTTFDLTKRIHSFTYNDKNDYDDILIDLDNNTLTEQDIQHIQLLPQIINQDEDISLDLGSSFTLNNLEITISSIDSYEKDLVNIY